MLDTGETVKNQSPSEGTHGWTLEGELEFSCQVTGDRNKQELQDGQRGGEAGALGWLWEGTICSTMSLGVSPIGIEGSFARNPEDRRAGWDVCERQQ